jgi:hypothetical protein
VVTPATLLRWHRELVRIRGLKPGSVPAAFDEVGGQDFRLVRVKTEFAHPTGITEGVD